MPSSNGTKALLRGGMAQLGQRRGGRCRAIVRSESWFYIERTSFAVHSYRPKDSPLPTQSPRCAGESHLEIQRGEAWFALGSIPNLSPGGQRTETLGEKDTPFRWPRNRRGK